MGENQAALESLQYGLTINPRQALFEEMAVTWRAMGDPSRAAVALLQGLTMDAGAQARLATELVQLYRETAPRSCALEGNADSVALNLNCPLVHSELCAAGREATVLYRQMQRGADAIATASSAVHSLGCPAEMFR
jgi:hypothetical protein